MLGIYYKSFGRINGDFSFPFIGKFEDLKDNEAITKDNEVQLVNRGLKEPIF